MYAFRLMYLPIGLFGVSIATAVLPAAARHAALEETVAVRRTVSRGLSLMLVLTVPATVGLMVLATPIVQLLLERGHFLPSDTAATAAALQYYAIGLVGYSTTRIASPVFYALGQSRIPVAASIVSIAFNVVASVFLVRILGFRGLALGTSLAAMANGAMLLWLLRRRLSGIDGNVLAATAAKVVTASGAMAAVAFVVEHWLTIVAPSAGTIAQALRLATAIGSGLIMLAIVGKLLRMPELDEAFGQSVGQVRKLLGR
jgi:putative peptidoglycan lipid II flippase